MIFLVFSPFLDKSNSSYLEHIFDPLSRDRESTVLYTIYILYTILIPRQVVHSAPSCCRGRTCFTHDLSRDTGRRKKTARKAPASSQGSFLLLYYPIFGFFCLIILILCLSNFTNTVFVEFLTNKYF